MLIGVIRRLLRQSFLKLIAFDIDGNIVDNH